MRLLQHPSALVRYSCLRLLILILRRFFAARCCPAARTLGANLFLAQAARTSHAHAHQHKPRAPSILSQRACTHRSPPPPPCTPPARLTGQPWGRAWLAHHYAGDARAAAACTAAVDRARRTLRRRLPDIQARGREACRKYRPAHHCAPPHTPGSLPPRVRRLRSADRDACRQHCLSPLPRMIAPAYQ